MNAEEIAALSDAELTFGLQRSVASERASLNALLLHLGEFSKRSLAAKNGYQSLYDYCTRRLGYSEAAAYRRIQAADAGRYYPVVLKMLSSGEIHLFAVAILCPYFTDANVTELLTQARGKSKLDLQRMVASLAPRPDGPDIVRRQPAVLGAAEQTLPVQANPSLAPRVNPQPLYLRQNIEPTAPERIRFSFSGSECLLGLLRRAQEILRHKYPAGDLELVFQDALEALLDKRDPDRRIRRKEERLGGLPALSFSDEPVHLEPTRRIPQAVRDAVWRRDGGQCVGFLPDGERCPERGGLEFDHIVPFALGGPSNNPTNLRLLCKSHNLQEARKIFGEAAVRPRL